MRSEGITESLELVGGVFTHSLPDKPRKVTQKPRVPASPLCPLLLFIDSIHAGLFFSDPRLNDYSFGVTSLRRPCFLT